MMLSMMLSMMFVLVIVSPYIDVTLMYCHLFVFSAELFISLHHWLNFQRNNNTINSTVVICNVHTCIRHSKHKRNQ